MEGLQKERGRRYFIRFFHCVSSGESVLRFSTGVNTITVRARTRKKLFSNNSTVTGEDGWSYEFDFSMEKVLSRSFGVRNACTQILDARDEGELPTKFEYPITRICTGVWRWRQLEGQICELISGVFENFFFYFADLPRMCVYSV